MLYWLFKLVLIGPPLRVLFRPWTEGAENVPTHGPAILASNHLSFSDSIFLPLMCPRRITFPAKSDYFTQPGLVGRLKAAFFRGTGQIPIDRSGGAASQVAMDAGLAVLRRGELFGIYPEGTRSPDGRLYKGKTGIARLALQAGVPVVPVAMIDTDKAQPTGQKIPNVMRVGMRFGEPMDFSQYQGRADDRVVLRTITDQIMAALAELSGQEYVDEYAATIKEQIAAKAESLVATAKAEGAQAQARAETFVATARAEGAQAQARAQARAEELISAARTEVENLRRRGQGEPSAPDGTVHAEANANADTDLDVDATSGVDSAGPVRAASSQGGAHPAVPGEPTARDEPVVPGEPARPDAT